MATPLPRSQFPVAEHHIYLNHAGVAPLPQAAVDAMTADARHVADHGSAVEPERFDRLDEVRLAAADLLGVSGIDVAFVKNTTEGLAFVAEGLDLKPGQRVLVPDREFPSTLFPFLALRDRGVRVDLIRPQGSGGALPLEAFAAALDEAPTALVAVSWVQFGTGWRTDLEVLADLCHRHGALLCADVIQGLGLLPCSLAEWGVDFAAADGHKWLLGPEGLGVLYVAAEHRDRLRVVEPGWASVAQREQWDDLRLDYDDSARRFEGGTLNVTGALGLGAAGAFLIHVVIAVTVGVAIFRLLPHRAVEAVVALLFLAGALFSMKESLEHEAEEVALEEAKGHKVITTAFIVIFLAEWGDLTQILTANLAAHYHSAISVGVGSVLALWAVAGVAVLGGKGLLRRLNVTTLRRVTAVILLVLAGITGWAALGL